MPNIITRGAHSARGFGLFGGGKLATFLGRIDSSPSSTLYIYDIATDAAGNFYIIALYVGGTLIAKFNAKGALQWQRRVNQDIQIGLASIAVDASGNVFGFYFTTDPVYGVYVGLLVKFNNSGTLQWQRTQYNTSNNFAHVGGNSIAVDGSGNVYVVGGYFTASWNAVIFKYDTSGTLLAQYQYNMASTSSSSAVINIAIDTSNNIYIAATQYDGTNRSVYIIKMNSSFTRQAEARLRLTSNDLYNYGFYVSSSGNVYVSGRNATNNRGFVAKYDSSLALQWSRYIYDSGGGNNPSFDVTTDAAENVYVLVTNQSQQYGAIAKYNSSGVIQWQRTLNTSGNDATYGVSVVGKGIYIVGMMSLRGLFGVVADDGSGTGTYTVGGVSLTYGVGSLTDAASGFTSSTVTSTVTTVTAPTSATSTFTTSTPTSSISVVTI